MKHYRIARILASVVVAIGWLIVGFGVVFFALSFSKPMSGGVVSLYTIASGVVVALFGWLCRAVFDIADVLRRDTHERLSATELASSRE